MSEMGMAMMGTGVAKGEDRAREAAERAVASPLLEDVDLSGARGILVNVTAGLDMAIGEFEEVGNTIKAFASENATVVVGTVIDPEMSDELRVTVVATGLGQGNASVAGQPVKLVVNKASGEEIEVDYDRPTVLRNQAKSSTTAGSDEKSMEYLDIPAFLRRQAD
jgi:cell division protein FtsZ